MRIALMLTTALVSTALLAGQALAFSCPGLQKAANESIGKAEANAAKVTGDREKARAAGMIEEAKELVKGSEEAHRAGNHGRSEAKAKAAKALADMVQ